MLTGFRRTPDDCVIIDLCIHLRCPLGRVISPIVFLALFCTVSAASVQAGESDRVSLGPSDPELVKARGYFFGYNFGNMLKEGGNEDVDTEMLLVGLRDSLSNAAPALTQAQQEAVLDFVRDRQRLAAAEKQAAAARAGEENLNMGKEFLAENADRQGVVVTDSGLQILEIQAGSGAFPRVSDRVLVHYEGRLISGRVFDSSRQRGQPAEFGLQQVIAGWTEGLQLMKAGGAYRLFVPSELAYGPGGTGNIPPNAVLIFDVELLEIIGG